MSSPKKPRILVIARGHLGDVICALPAIRDLRAGYPSAHIAVMCNEYVRGALEACPLIDEVIYGFTYARRPAWKKVASRLKLLAQVAGRYDFALSLHFAPRSGPLLGVLSGARVRIGYHVRGWIGRLLTTDLGWERVQSRRLTNAAVIKALGLAASPSLPLLDWVPESERERADEVLARAGVAAGEAFAVFQIASHWGCYEWRSDKWASLAEHLGGVYGFKVVVVGTDEDFEKHKFADLAALTDIPVSVQGLTSLPMLFHIVSRASIAIAADSALTQIAMAQRVPSVILFGIEPSARNAPLPEEHGAMETIQRWDPDTAPPPNPHCLFGQAHCHTPNCRENSSFEQISAGDVCARVDRILARRRVPERLPTGA